MTDRPRPSVPEMGPRLVGLLTALVLGLVLAVWMAGSTKSIRHWGDNITALRTAMTSGSGSLDTSKSLYPAPETVTTGVQARAMAHALAAAGKFSEAEAWLVAGLSDSASTDLTQFQLCRLYWEIGLRAQALRVCQGSVVSADYWLGAGIRALDGGDPDGALKLFEMAAYISPDSAEGWRRYGESLLRGGRPEEAVAALERVLFLTNSPEADVYSSLADAYLKVDNLTMARDVLNVGLLNYPDNRDYYRAMAESFLADEDAKTADSWYVRMLQRWPYDAEVWAARGRIAQDNGRIADAMTYYEQAATNSPDGFGYWMNLASVAAMAKDAALVSRATSKALELRPNEPGAWLQSGRYLTETGQNAAAAAAFKQVLILQPDNAEAVAELDALDNQAAP